MKKAATYLRSSKDRKDVSLDVQRRELEQLAASKDLAIAIEYSDVVESGKDEDRPGYQKLLAAVTDRNRGWDHLLILDTSRLARRQHIAMAFTHQCQRRGIKILYAKVPEMDPINEVLVLSVMRAMDEMHSMMSREKGNAGMAENVRQGYRAGGRAPIGYSLQAVDIGLVREGKAVTKTVLQLGDKAPAVKAYLQRRAKGQPRVTAKKESGLDVTDTTAIGMEYNALTYAGCTVWNVHRECGQDGYGGKGKRRPRAEWVVKEATHEALISMEEAETILRRMESSDHGKAVSQAKRANSSFLLSSVLVDPNGLPWRGMNDRSGPAYRLQPKEGRGRVVRAWPLERAILRKLAEDLASDEMAQGFYDHAQSAGKVDTAPRLAAQAELQALTRKVDQAVEAALFLTDPAPIYRKIDELERMRKAKAAELDELREEEKLQRAAAGISLASIKDLLGGLADSLERTAPEQRKELLALLVEKIKLDPASDRIELHYRLAASAAGTDCLTMASPRGFDRSAVFRFLQVVQLAA